MEPGPLLFIKELLEIPLNLLHISAPAQTPPYCQPMNMGVDRKCRNFKGVRHYAGGGFVSHAGKSFKLGKAYGHFSSMPFCQNL